MYIETVGSVERHKTIADMEIGETCYTVPWSVTYDEDGYVAGFDMGMAVDDEQGQPGQTARLAITKRGEDDYIFDVSKCGWYQRH